MPRINLPPGCYGFSDDGGNRKYIAERGPGSYVNIDDSDPAGQLALKKLKNQDYATAGLVDAGPQKEFIGRTKKPGKWCKNCNFLGHSWMTTCAKCGRDTVSETDMEHPAREGQYIP